MPIAEPESLTEIIGQGFEKHCLRVRLDQLLPRKSLPKGVKQSKKYRQIAASIAEIGLVEAPVIARDPENSNLFFILDGHLRIEILKGLDRGEVECLISTDDEAFTYNKQVSRLAAVQEHAMIVSALKHGVPEERIAAMFAVNIATIRRRKRMLNGVCMEAADFSRLRTVQWRYLKSCAKCNRFGKSKLRSS